MASTNSNYQPIPNSDDSDFIKPPEYPQPARNRYSFRRLLVIALALLLVSFASYKFGQWSVSPSPGEQTTLEDIKSITPPESTSIATTTSSSQPKVTETTGQDTMTSGKYSVG
jgi:hypothetical protein